MKFILVALCTVSAVTVINGQGHSRGPSQRGQVFYLQKSNKFGKKVVRIYRE